MIDSAMEKVFNFFDTEQYKRYLTTMSKFHDYSFNNTLLIMSQKPEATFVAGYNSWQKNFERHVNPGEKGIKILAPAQYKKKKEVRCVHIPTAVVYDKNAKENRKEAMLLFEEELENASSDNHKVLVMGDFNTEPQGTDEYYEIFDRLPYKKQLDEKTWRD